MRRAVLLLCLSIFVFELQAQSREFNRLYSSFRGEKDVINIYIPGFLCRWASNIDDLEPEEQELLRSIKSLKVLVIENPEINSQVNLAKEFSLAEWDKGIVPLLQVHEDDEDVLILAREEDSRITELYVVVGGSENVMVKICGRMDRDLMKSIYDVTGIEQTKVTQKI